MQISAFAPAVANRPAVRSSSPESPAETPQNDDYKPSAKSKAGDYLKMGAVSAVCGGIGYVGSLAHNIPFIGPVISGGVGAIAGASAGATAAALLPGEKVKLGAVLGGLGGAILGASGGGSLATNVLMAAGAATAPYGLLIAIFSGAE